MSKMKLTGKIAFSIPQLIELFKNITGANVISVNHKTITKGDQRDSWQEFNGLEVTIEGDIEIKNINIVN